MTEIVFVGCEAMPSQTESDALLAGALAARGARVSLAPWTGPFAPFAAADAVVLRATWDYAARPDAFRAFLKRLAREARTVMNAPALMCWNMEKTYLRDLAERGAQVVETVFLDADISADALMSEARARDWADCILKPVVSANARGLSRFDARARGEAQAALEAASAFSAGGLMLQATLTSVSEIGEASLIYADGVFTHAVLKRPKAGDVRVQENHGGSTKAFDPPAAALATAEKTLSALDETPVYARVDITPARPSLDAPWRLMELELIEPDLYLDPARTNAAAGLAQAILKRVG